MLKPKESQPLPDAGDVGPGMDDILRSIQGILGEDADNGVRFPEPEARANDDGAAEAEITDGPREAPLAFLRRRRMPDTVEHIDPTPAMPSLDERLERHRAKAQAERDALRELAERATARAAEVSVEVAAEEKGAVDETDLFAETEDMTAPPPSPVAPAMRTLKPRPGRLELPEIEAEPVDYSGRPHAGRSDDGRRAFAREPEMIAPGPAAQPDLEETFEDIARAMLTDPATDMETMLSDMVRPLVREWLEDNLSAIVERVVKAEIERVSRGER